jgi:response regulator of citrate/malate metabolism
MKVLMIDDLKKIEEFFTKEEIATFSRLEIARTYKEGMRLLDEENWDLLLLDHDLGGFKDGMDILDYLEIKLLINPLAVPKKIKIITKNLAEILKMEELAKKLTDENYKSNFLKRFKN